MVIDAGADSAEDTVGEAELILDVRRICAHVGLRGTDDCEAEAEGAALQVGEALALVLEADGEHVIGVGEEIVAPLDLGAITAVEDDAVGWRQRIQAVDVVAIVVRVGDRDPWLPYSVEQHGPGLGPGEVLLGGLEGVRIFSTRVQLGLAFRYSARRA